MKDFAKEFYQSKAWRDIRRYVFDRDLRLCQRCDKPCEIVHHKIYLTQKNINDPSVALNVVMSSLARTL